MKKNKLVFIIFHGMVEGNGVSNKIQSQINAFRYNGYEVDFSYLVQENGFLKKRYYNDTLIETVKKGYYSQKYGYKYRYNKLLKKIIEQKAEAVYIRYTHFANPMFIHFLSKLKKENIKILLEIPTFPYDSEFKNAKFKQKLFLKVEKASRRFFKYYCHKIVTVSEDDKIFGTDTIKISNGIEINTIKPKKKTLKKDAESYRFLGLANIQFWHGYDRLIKGLNDYYSNSNPQSKVYFDIIGDNNDTESQKYRALVEKYGLEKYVIFHGVLKANELDEHFDNADLAVGSLGIHRIGLKEAKPIKNREYCAKGIPFMYAMIDRDFDNKDFVIRFPADETNININTIIDFLKDNTFSAETERKYAEKNLTWNAIVKKIISEM